MTARQTNLMLEVLLVAAITTGLGSWMVATDWARVFTIAHAVSGLAVLVVAPYKVRGSVARGLRRGRPSRWLSVAFGLVVSATIGLGLVHAVGLWFGVGQWSALWTHQLLGFVSIPFLVWHVWTRPVRPRRTDVDRRSLLRFGAVAAAAGGAVAVQEVVVRVVGTAGADRAGTGSHEVASFEPTAMPIVSWIDDVAPDLDPAAWPLMIAGRSVDVAEIAVVARPLRAALDCTGGWWSDQEWDVVPLSTVLPAGEGRSVMVTSATGYRRLFSLSATDDVFLCTGYGGQPLRRGHGAPLRIVAPGRRGPWWIKWVTTIEFSDRPSWLQLPLPAT